MNKENDIFAILDRYYLIGMCLVGSIIIWANYYSTGMAGIVPYYQDFKHVILSGFDPKASIHQSLTFPMWGYGWLFIITENTMLIYLIQNVLFILSVWYFFRTCKNNHILSKTPLLIIKFLLIITIPLYAFNCVLWPYSISISLIILSSAFFVTINWNERKNQFAMLLASGMLLGLAFNFRSDYYLLPFAVALTIGLFFKFKGNVIVKVLIWLFSVYIMLFPWAIYCKQVIGHYLITSTNSGHVFFIGLGNLPNNKWKITPSDDDPVMKEKVKQSLGPNVTSLDFKGDSLLKKEFVNYVVSDPKEYLKKCIYNLRRMFIDGVYPGEFYNLNRECYPNCDKIWLQTRAQMASQQLSFFLRNNPETSVRAILEIGSRTIGRIIVFLGFLILPFAFIWGIKIKNLPLLLLCLISSYQAAINVFAYYMYTYTTNILLFMIVMVGCGIFFIASYLLNVFHKA